MMDLHELKLFNAKARAELQRLEAQSTAKEVAGKAIGKHGLMYITIIIIVGVAASLALDKDKIAAVIGLVSAALTALIAMVSGIAGSSPKQEKPEFEVMKQLIDRLDRMADRDPMSVSIDGDKVVVKKGENETTTTRGA